MGPEPAMMSTPPSAPAGRDQRLVALRLQDLVDEASQLVAFELAADELGEVVGGELLEIDRGGGLVGLVVRQQAAAAARRASP